MDLVIEKHPDVPDNFAIFEAQNSIHDYFKVYGNDIALANEQAKVCVFPSFPLKYDAGYLHQITFPEEFRKCGANNGIDKSLYVRTNNRIELNERHILFQSAKTDPVGTSYLYEQIKDIFDQIRVALHVLYPAYQVLQEGNITWRFCRTGTENMHYDAFVRQAPETLSAHRIKLFINLDNDYRVWRVSYNMVEFMERYGDRIPGPKKRHMNDLSADIAKYGDMANIPYHTVLIPPGAVIVANGDFVAHQVVYGHRMVVAEYFVPPQYMIDSSLRSSTLVYDKVTELNMNEDALKVAS